MLIYEVARQSGMNFAHKRLTMMGCDNSLRLRRLRTTRSHGYLEQEVDTDVLRILILEDYTPLRRVLTALLQRAGYQIDVARTPREMLHMLGQQTYALLVMDMDLSIRDVGGAIQALRTASRHLPVVVLLSPQSHWVGDVKSLGIQTVLYKSVDRQALLSAIETTLTSLDDANRKSEADE